MTTSKIRILILKIISLLAIFSFIYPVLMYVRCDNFYVTGGFFGLSYDLMLILGGYFIGEYLMSEKSFVYVFFTSHTSMKVFFENKRSVHIWLRIISVASVFVPLLVTFLIYVGSGKIRILYEMLSAVIFYLAGILQIQKDYHRILTTAKIVTGSVSIFVLLLVSSNFKWALYLKPVLYAFTYIFIVLCMIIKNVSNLDTKIYLKKGADNTPVSKKVKKKNIVYTTVLFLITAILSNINAVSQLLYNCIKWISVAITSGFSAFMRFVRSIFVSEVTLKQTENEASNILARKAGKPSLIATAITIVLIIALFNFLYKLLKLHWNSIKTSIRSFFKTLLQKIKKLVKRSDYDYLLARKVSVIEYEDEIEKISMVSKVKLYSLINKSTSKRRSLKKYKDPVKQVREGYAYLIESLAAKKIHIKKSNTPSEIYCETKQIKGFDEQFETITRMYEKVRYQDALPSDQDINIFDEKSSKAVHIIKKLP